jgi:hypothetical protein
MGMVVETGGATLWAKVAPPVFNVSLPVAQA